MKSLRKALLSVTIGLSLLSCKENEEQMWVSIRNNTNSAITCNLEPKNPGQIARVDRAVIESDRSIDIAISSEVSKDPINLFTQKYGSLRVALENGTLLEFSSESDPLNYTLNPFDNNDAWVLTLQEEMYSTNSGSTDVKVWNYEFVVDEANVIE